MAEARGSGRIVRFGVFEADLGAGELRKHGLRIRLQEQPFRILAALLERPGEIVTREELIQKLWPNGTVVEYEHSLGTAVNKIRQALGDTADNPRFVETVPRRGYRFLPPVEAVPRPSESPAESPSWQTAGLPSENGVISHYRILEKLGEGGMGVVYKAEDTKLERLVALKFLAPQAIEDPEHKARFVREAKAAARLDHPNICPIHEIDEVDGQLFLTMAYLEGQTVKDKIAERPLPLEEALDIAIQTAEGLQAAHEKGIVHRDIKSVNLMLSPKGRVKIMDFGLAQLADGTRLTKGPAMLGTPAYMSPEQAQRQPADRRTDIWSLGVVLYEMVTGRVPFASDRETATLHAIIHEDPEPITALRTGVPIELDAIVAKALAKDQQARYQDVDDLMVDLRGLCSEVKAGQSSKRHSSSAQTPEAFSRRKWAVRYAAVALAVATAVAAALAVAMWYGTRTRVWENPLAGAQIERLTDFDGIETDAAISRDGKSVAFLSDRDGSVDAWVTRIGTGQFANLTKGRISGLLLPGIRSVGFSHDGEQVWLRVEQDSEGRVLPQGSWYVSVMGGVPRRFLENGVEPEWAPDGTKLAYHEPVGGDPIFVADGNGANPRKIFSEQPGGHCHHLTWSLDGRFVYFVRGLPLERTDIWRVSTTGGEPERITQHNSDVQYPTLLDAETLLYTATSDDGSGPWLYAVDLQDRVPRRVSVGVEQYLSLAGSADGQRLVASVANPSGELWTVPILDRVALETDVTKHPMTATRTTGPRFGPDYLLYLSSMGGAHGLWRHQTGESTELWKAIDGGVAGPPAISPDGLAVSFSVRKPSGGDLYIMTPHGTNLRQIDLGRIHDIRGSPSWSPDGKWIALTAYEGDQRRLFKVPVDGGAPVALIDGSPTSPLWLPDGKLILYRVRQGPSFSLRAVTSDGSAASVPPHLTSASSFDGYRVIPGTQTLISLQGDVPSQNFWITELKTGMQRRLTDFKASLRIRSFDISPDGKQIIFDRWSEDSDIVLIERARR